MEEVKKEVVAETVDKKETVDTYTKKEVDDLLNNKIAAIFGDILKEINKPKEVVKEAPKEKTEKELRF